MTVIWSVSARQDLARIFSFNIGWDEGWALRVDARLVERAEMLGRVPMMGRPLASSGVRLMSIPDIQYVLLYRVEGVNVIIVRVHHTRENREYR